MDNPTMAEIERATLWFDCIDPDCNFNVDGQHGVVLLAAYRAKCEELAALQSQSPAKPNGWPSWQAKAETMERFWHGATETHNQVREMYDKQNAELRAIIEDRLPSDAPEGFARRLLGMDQEDRDYILSIAAGTLAQADREARG